MNILKKIYFKIAVVLLCLVMILVTGYGCGDNESGSHTVSYPASYGYGTGIDYTADSFDFIADGQTEYKIIVPDDAGDEIVEAASELVQYVREVSGAEMFFISETEWSETGNVISLGDTRLMQNRAQIDSDAVKHDGFVIKTVGKDVFIAADIDRGVRYGVYSFIERFLGVRWLTPTFTHVPSMKTVLLYPCDITEEPEFEMRRWYGYSTNPQYNEAFYNHSRTYFGNWYNPGKEYHNTTDYADQPGTGYLNKADIDPNGDGVKTLAETHPEYFTDATNPSQYGYYDICFTNGVNADGTLKDGESGVGYIIDKIKGILANDTDMTYDWFMIGKMDYRGLICKCATCLERYDEIGFSGVTVMFINCIEREVNEWLEREQGRTVNFATFAYHDAEEPPVKENGKGGYEPINALCKANEHVYMRVAPIDANYAYAINDVRQPNYEYYKKMFDGWDECSDHMLVWDYVINYFDNLMYYPNLSYYKENLKLYKSKGVNYVMSEAVGTKGEYWHVELRCYVANRLYWNLGWDVDYLVNEFIELYYGAAADGVMAVIDAYELFYAEMRSEGTLSIDVSKSQTSFNNTDTYSPEFIEHIFDIIDNAERGIMSDATLSAGEKQAAAKKLDKVKLSPMTLVLKNYGKYYDLGTEAEFVTEFIEICDEWGINNLGSGRTVQSYKDIYGV